MAALYVAGFARLLVALAVVLPLATAAAALYSADFYVSWAPENVRAVNDDRVWELTLSNSSASGIASKDKYLFGYFSVSIKLVPNDSAGTVTAFYFSSETENWDEVDFEFLGNVSGQPYILQTNVFWNGTGEREQRVNLWFDPTADYHKYEVLWNPNQILITVDGIPIRVVSNYEAKGIPFLSRQPLRLFASIWDGSSWATSGGRVPIDWAHSPFLVSLGDYVLDACHSWSSASCLQGKWWNSAQFQSLTAQQQGQLNWVTSNYMAYNYCTDKPRNPIPPAECPESAHSWTNLEAKTEAWAPAIASRPASSAFSSEHRVRDVSGSWLPQGHSHPLASPHH